MIIDVWADVVCPWCFIGKRRLERALATFEFRDHVTIRHRAFQLQPDIKETVRTKEYLAEKYLATPEQVSAMQSNVCAVADGEGLCYNLDETLSGNTFDAHRLLLWAGTIGKQEELLEVLFSNYFEKSKGVFTHTDLVAAAITVGIDADKADDLLTSDLFADEVISDRNLAAQLGATGVPFFVFDMKFGISGAQPLEAFTQTLESAWEQEVAATQQ
jgi:predicted DsbA family dithiol-disulfide isomerase